MRYNFSKSDICEKCNDFNALILIGYNFQKFCNDFNKLELYIFLLLYMHFYIYIYILYNIINKEFNRLNEKLYARQNQL